jgi:protein-arginine kinase activator protein McsA
MKRKMEIATCPKCKIILKTNWMFRRNGCIEIIQVCKECFISSIKKEKRKNIDMKNHINFSGY